MGKKNENITNQLYSVIQRKPRRLCTEHIFLVKTIKHVKLGSLLKKGKNMKFERLFEGYELLLNNIYCNYIVCSMAHIYFIGI